jgi:hypothetical protein
VFFCNYQFRHWRYSDTKQGFIVWERRIRVINFIWRLPLSLFCLACSKLLKVDYGSLLNKEGILNIENIVYIGESENGLSV